MPTLMLYYTELHSTTVAPRYQDTTLHTSLRFTTLCLGYTVLHYMMLHDTVLIDTAQPCAALNSYTTLELNKTTT